MRMGGKAKKRIRPGELVLCRNFEVAPAPATIANATANAPRFGKDWKRGEWVEVTPIEGLGERDLHAMAAGPIMEPLKLYLPAGKITEAEYQERLKLDFKRAGIDEVGA